MITKFSVDKDVIRGNTQSYFLLVGRALNFNEKKFI